MKADTRVSPKNRRPRKIWDGRKGARGRTKRRRETKRPRNLERGMEGLNRRKRAREDCDEGE